MPPQAGLNQRRGDNAEQDGVHQNSSSQLTVIVASWPLVEGIVLS
jgi:hypothetical protein